MTISVWFWNDINDELKEYRMSHSLATTTKVWRWSLTFVSINFLIQSLHNISCIYFINSTECVIWLESFVQWAAIKLPKSGRHSVYSNNGRDLFNQKSRKN